MSRQRIFAERQIHFALCAEEFAKLFDVNINTLNNINNMWQMYVFCFYSLFLQIIIRFFY